VQEETWLKALPTTGFSPKGQSDTTVYVIIKAKVNVE